MHGLFFGRNSGKVDSGVWKPVKVTRRGMGISHLLFADDILLFAKAKVSQLRIIMKVLKDFEEISGLAVNVDKSKIMVSGNVNRRK